MNRSYDTGTLGDVAIFMGKEVENTPMKDRLTLFVVGLHNPDKLYQYCRDHNISHVYLGANMSFNAQNIETWQAMAQFLLQKGIWVTLDFDIRYATVICEMGLNSYNNFIPMISVKVPYTQLFNYNTCLKLDDKDFAVTNPGVWVHQLHDLMDRSCFTDWSKYTQDHVLERSNNVIDQNTITK